MLNLSYVFQSFLLLRLPSVLLFAGATVEQFEQAKSKLSTLKEDPGNEAKLKIYALFKQVGA